MQKKSSDIECIADISMPTDGSCALAPEPADLPDQQETTGNRGYRVFGKYKVQETFAGKESLTSLLSQYVERTVAVRY